MVRVVPSMERPLSSAAVMPLSEKTTAVPPAALWDAKAAGPTAAAPPATKAPPRAASLFFSGSNGSSFLSAQPVRGTLFLVCEDRIARQAKDRLKAAQENFLRNLRNLNASAGCASDQIVLYLHTAIYPRRKEPFPHADKQEKRNWCGLSALRCFPPRRG